MKWGKSEGGYVKSKCGRFSISPLHCGRVKPLFWSLFDAETKRTSDGHFTQRAAKSAAEEVSKKVTPPKSIW